MNILSGVNGIGKSTILNRAATTLDHMAGGVDIDVNDVEGVKMTFYPENATTIHFDVIRSFDRPLFHSNLAEKDGRQECEDRARLATLSVTAPLSGLSR